MPVDPSIPLQVRRPDFMTPQQAVQLQSLVQDQTMRRLQIAQTQKAMQEEQAIRSVFARPDAIDPNTGQPSAAALSDLAKINPEYYRKSQAAALQAATQLSQLTSAQELIKQRQNAARKEAEELVKDIDEYAVSFVQPYVDSKAHPEEINRQYMQARREEIERRKEAGTITPEQYESFIKTPTNYGQALARIQTPAQKAALEHQKKAEAHQQFEEEATRKRLAHSEEELKLARKREARAEATAAGPPVTDEGLDFAARQYLAGNQQAGLGYARSPALKAKLLNRIAEIAGAQGKTPEQINTALAEFEGFRSGQRTLGGRGANLSIAGAELDQFVPIAQAASDKVPRTQFKAINQLARIGREQWSPEQAAFEAANRSVINAFAQLASRGVPTVHNTEEAEKMLNTAQTPEQYSAVLKQLQTEARGALKAIQEAQGAMRGEHPQQGPQPLPKNASEWEPGTVYQTPQGPAEWTGRFDNGKPIFKRSMPKVQSTEEAKKLAPGTHFIGPDGNEYIR